MCITIKFTDRYLILNERFICEIFNDSNKNIKMSSFKSSENIQKKKGGSDRSVLDNQSSSVNLNELAMKAKNNIL